MENCQVFLILKDTLDDTHLIPLPMAYVDEWLSENRKTQVAVPLEAANFAHYSAVSE